MKVNEIFQSIQGEGRHAGTPATFVRLCGCNRECHFCDTKYHKDGKEMSVDEVAKEINSTKLETVVWTGGEPMLQIKDISDVVHKTEYKAHHLETNGDVARDYQLFSYIAVSPKSAQSAICVDKKPWIDVKVVTDLKFNENLIPYATMLMPLTTGNPVRDAKTRQEVWNYCVEKGLSYSPRLHVDVFGNQKGK